MNHIFRVVFNLRTGEWVAVPEMARGRGKSAKVTPIRAAAAAVPRLIACMLGLGAVHVAIAQSTAPSVNVASGGTIAYVAPNGVTVVNIEAPNAAGLSHNRYNRYNVDPSGLVLNNGDASQIVRQSLLAGQVMANLNLQQGAQAKVILNEVVANNRSTLAGFTEVLGGRADVVVANPWGITCSGCGFINTDRVTLTTGLPFHRADGSIGSFNVQQGDILVQGTGLNATAQQVLDLVTRAVRIDGSIHAQELNVATGIGAWDTTSRGFTPGFAAVGGAPAVSIDSSALGGMYANRIRLTATESGVGVRMLGDVAASAEDFTLSAAGSIDLRARVSAQRDLTVASSNGGAGPIALMDASLNASRNIAVSTDTTLTVQGGAMVAGGQLGVTAVSLTDQATTNLSVNDNNRRHAGGALVLNVTGVASASDTTWSATNSLAVQAGQLDLNAGAELASRGTLNLTADGIDNAGTVRAVGAAALRVGADELRHTGTLQAGGDLSLLNKAGVNHSTTADSGAVIEAGGTLRVQGEELKVANGAQVTAGSVDIDVQSMVVSGSGSLSAQGDLMLTTDLLGVTGASSRIMGATSGQAQAQVDITALQSGSVGGLVYSGSNLGFRSPSLEVGTTGAMVALGDLNVSATTGDLTNSGALYAGGDLSATATNGSLTNMSEKNGTPLGTMDAGGDIHVAANAFTNHSRIVAGGNVAIDANALRNRVVSPNPIALSNVRQSLRTDYTGESNYYDFPNGYEVDNYRTTWYQDEFFVDGEPVAKPEIIAGSALSLAFQTGENVGGVLSGNTVNLAGKGAGASFVNDALALERRSYTQTYQISVKCLGICGAAIKEDPVRIDGTPTYTTSNIRELGAGVYANVLSASGFALTNKGTPFQAVLPDQTDVAPAPGSLPTPPLPNDLLGNLPTNPNGFFVPTSDPQSRFLVETNPLYQAGSSAFGSDYLAKLLGYDVDDLGKRLGDSGYEAHLVRQQLIRQTGANLLAGFANADAQMKGLMESAAGQGTALGLKFGEPLTEEQRAGLKSDIVWMVATQVNGQTVLSPVVYLAPTTLQNVIQGAVIQASTASLNLASLTNVGGSLIGTQSLDVVAQGDITNISGTITGGDVRLSSTGGSVINQTLVQGNGDDTQYQTTIGKTGTIASTGNLTINAAQDVQNLGADMRAGGNASLNAGGDVTFDTVQDRTVTTTTQGFRVGGVDGTSTTRTETTTQVLSGLQVGGNLDMQAGNDITLAGTQARVAGDAALDAGGDINLIARENTTTTNTTSRASGFGMGGSLFGTTTVKTDSESVRNVGSSFDVGGDAALSAGDRLLVQGSDLAVTGSGTIDANSVDVLAGRNFDTSTTTTTSTRILGGTGSNQLGTDPGKPAAVGATSKATSAGTASGGGGVSAQASAAGGASGQAAGGLLFYGSTTTTTTSVEERSVGSNLSFGENLTINATEDLTLQGSNVAAGGSADVNASNINLLAASNTSSTTTTTRSTAVGLMGSTSNQVGASAGVSASASGAKGLPNAQAGAAAGGSATSDNKIALFESTRTTTSSRDVTNTGSSLSAGDQLNITASETLNVQGSSLASGGDMNLTAQDMTFAAVDDISETSSSSNRTSVGLYARGTASGTGNAGANAGVGATAGASASVAARAEVGIYGSNDRSSEAQGSTTARTSSIQAGGNLNRTATGNITDVGTQATVGGNLTQSADTFTSLAAADTTYSRSSDESVDVRIGAYAQAGASATASVNVGPGGLKTTTTTNVDKGAGVGINAQYEKEQASERSSTAVVSSFQVGGNATLSTTGDTRLQGTTIQSGGDTTINAALLDYSAAANTTQSSGSNLGVSASLDVDIANKSASVGVAAEGGSSSASTSTAVVGGVTTGGAFTVNTTGNTRLEGTQVDAAGPVALNAGGDLVIDAARNTVSERSREGGGSLNVSAGGKEGSGSLQAGYGQSSLDTSKAVVASIRSGSDISTSSGGDTRLVGSQLAAGGDLSVATGGNLDVVEARDTSRERSMNVDVAGAGGKGETKVNGTRSMQQSGSASVGGGFQNADSSTAQVASLSGGGNVSLSSGNDTKLVGTQIDAGQQASVRAGGEVTLAEAVSTSSQTGFQGSVSAQASTSTPKGGGGKTGTGTSGTGTSGTGTSGTGTSGTSTSGTGTSGTGISGTTKARPPVSPNGGSGVVELSVTNKKSSETMEVAIAGEQGLVIQSGLNSARPTVTAKVNLPAPVRGATVQASTADGKPLPQWLTFDAGTGTFKGTPPAGTSGDLRLQVNITQPDGSTVTRQLSIALQ